MSGAYQLASGPIYISNDKPGKTIKKITFDNGTLEFTLSANNKYILSIVLKDKSGNALRTVSFDTQQFPGQGYRYLSKVNIKDRSLNNVEVYEMNYNESTTSVSNNLLAVDYLGYLCSNSQSPSFGYVPMAAFTFDAVTTQPWVGSIAFIGPNNAYTNTVSFGSGNRDPVFSMALA